MLRKEPRLLRADLLLLPTFHIRTVSHSLATGRFHDPRPLVTLARSLQVYVSTAGRVRWGGPVVRHEQELLLPWNERPDPNDYGGRDTVIGAHEIQVIPGYEATFTRGDGSGFLEAIEGKEGETALVVTGREEIDYDASGSLTWAKDTFSLSLTISLYDET